MKTRGCFFLLTIALGATSVAGCPQFPAADNICDLTPCGPLDGSTDGAPGVDAPPGCDLSKDPKESFPCVDDSVGIFVSPTGDDGNAGTKGAPVRTIARALTISGPARRIYLCDGQFNENVKLTAANSIFGGLSCTWEYTGAKPLISPPSGLALEARTASTVVIGDVEVIGSSSDATQGGSAIAALVVGGEVTLRRVALTARDGRLGANGGSVVNWSGTAVPGNSQVAAAGGPAPSCGLCLDQTFSTAGKGADSSGLAGSGGSRPDAGPDNSGFTNATTCIPGGPGATGAQLLAGPSADPSLGTLTSDGWETRIAAKGMNGNPGQGGGGGGGKTNLSSGGGSGGCGGCGGAGGDGGKGGGSSLALLVVGAKVTVDSSVLAAGGGGTGGVGGEGQPGQAGAGPGDGACAGGMGGAGSGGGGGTGGTGGSSIAIVWTGTEPSLKDSTLHVKTPGLGGLGGPAGAGPGNPGVAGSKGTDGKAQEVLGL
jgi:hypothetical protein